MTETGRFRDEQRQAVRPVLREIRKTAGIPICSSAEKYRKIDNEILF